MCDHRYGIAHYFSWIILTLLYPNGFRGNLLSKDHSHQGVPTEMARSTPSQRRRPKRKASTPRWRTGLPRPVVCARPCTLRRRAAQSHEQDRTEYVGQPVEARVWRKGPLSITVDVHRFEAPPDVPASPLDWAVRRRGGRVRKLLIRNRSEIYSLARLDVISGRALGTNPGKARLRFDPESPIVDGRWPTTADHGPGG